MVRARELGIRIGTGTPGEWNAITDVPGVRVGHTTLIEGDGPLVVGRGPIRTGVTVIQPHEGDAWSETVFAAGSRLNGNGELTGLEFVRECGQLTSPIGITNTHSVGVVRDALVAAEVEGRSSRDVFWGLPVVGETWDGRLNDINGFHVKREHVFSALEAATSGPVTEGNVGGGTGMVCHGFKGGVGTSSRVVAIHEEEFVVGVLVQANHGRRDRLRVDGVPVGEEVTVREVPLPDVPASDVPVSEGAGSIIVIVATSAPLLPHQLARIALRPAIGIGRMGGLGEHYSGDIFLAFSTAKRIPAADYLGAPPLSVDVSMLSDAYISPIFEATVEATEEAILNALLSAETMTGRDGVVAHRLPPERLVEILRKYNRAPGAAAVG
jgi:D-aminopeptidase